MKGIICKELTNPKFYFTWAAKVVYDSILISEMVHAHNFTRITPKAVGKASKLAIIHKLFACSYWNKMRKPNVAYDSTRNISQGGINKSM